MYTLFPVPPDEVEAKVLTKYIDASVTSVLPDELEARVPCKYSGR